MKTSEDLALGLLHSLLRLCRDGVSGYETAIRDMPDDAIKAELEAFHHRRAKMVTELEQRIRDLRGDPDTGATLLGQAHQVWMDAVAGSAANPIQAVLSEVVRGENVTVSAYRQALKEHDIDPVSRRLLEQHHEFVQTAHDRVRQLHDRTDYAAHGGDASVA